MLCYCLSQLDFVWINRDQKSFEWFVGLLAQLEMEQNMAGSFDDFLEMQMYMTSALNKNDMKALGLQMALEILHRKEKRDVVTGLKTRTQAGRPQWDEVRIYKLNLSTICKIKMLLLDVNSLLLSLYYIAM